MKVAIVSPKPDDNSGGVERFCHTLAGCLTELGADATVVGSTTAARMNPDLVITNAEAGASTSAPRIHVYHGCWVEHMRYDHRTASRRWRAKRTLQGAVREIRAGLGAYRVSVSATTAAELERWYRFGIHQIIPNSVDTVAAEGWLSRSEARRTLGIEQGRRIALFIGRADYRKRPDIAAHVSAEAGYELFTAGAGTFPGGKSLGVLSPTEVMTWVRAADCVLSPSDYEACSLAILEALAAGTPVIASRVGWIDTLIADVPSYRPLTAARGDQAGFTAALRALADNTTASTAAIDYVRENNSLKVMQEQWSSLLNSLPMRRR